VLERAGIETLPGTVLWVWSGDSGPTGRAGPMVRGEDFANAGALHGSFRAVVLPSERAWTGHVDSGNSASVYQQGVGSLYLTSALADDAVALGWTSCCFVFFDDELADAAGLGRIGSRVRRRSVRSGWALETKPIPSLGWIASALS
jgi:hypothetical protein